MARDPIQALARSALGHRRLRPGQREAVEALLRGRDVLAVMPTGSGKSAIYQLAALRIPGPTVVVSPLVALQRDQVEAIRARRLGAAQANAAIPATERRQALEDLEQGDLEFLFLAPEQLANAETLERLRAARPSLVVVDEAHCISSWGHDFRPDYARLGAMLEALGRPVALALTATAAPPVRREIVERLGLRDPVVVVRGFDRPNIHLAVERFSDGEAKDAAVLDMVEADGGRGGLVYVATRRRAETLAASLAGRGVRARAYHAGLPAGERRAAQAAFMDEPDAVLVATTAFGMGIDKAEVRFVFHADAPGSLDAYHQEIGRAGRDGEPAEAVLFYRPEDLRLRRFFAAAGQLSVDHLERVVEALHRRDRPVDAAELRQVTGLSATKLDAVVNQLVQVGAAEVDPSGAVDRGRQDLDPDEVVQAAAGLEEDHQQVEQSRIEMLRGYAEGDRCRRELLLSYLGEPFQPPCGNCDNCEAGLAATGKRPAATPFPVQARVRHRAWGPGTVLRSESDRVVVLFDQAGYKTLSTQTVLRRGLLTASEAPASKRQLYQRARQLGVKGRSRMSAEELAAAVHDAEGTAANR
jgi:ATP-dependent DNA helicase RecQ